MQVMGGALLANPSTSVDYGDLASALVKRFGIIMGFERAITLARAVDGIDVDGGGRVTRCTVDALDRLARHYQAIGGTVALLLMKRTVAPMARAAHLNLPPSLR